MSSERTYAQAMAEMLGDRERRYSCGGNTYKIDSCGHLRYLNADNRWSISAGYLEDVKWYRILSDKEREDSYYRSLSKQVAESAMQTALNNPDAFMQMDLPGLNICSSETPRPAQNPNPKKAFGATKPDLALVPPVAGLQMAMAFEVGADKYGAYNWRKDPVEAMTYVAAMMRHAYNFLDGEDISSDGVSNLGQVMACCAILLDSQALGILIDNRPLPGKSSEVQDQLQAQKKAKLALVKKAV